MKRKSGMFLGLCFLFLSAVGYAQIQPTPWYPKPERPVLQQKTTGVMTLYIIGGSTTSAADYGVYETSMVCRTHAGIYPGTHAFILANYDSYETLISSINALPSATIGMEGKAVAAFVQGCYRADDPKRLRVTNSQLTCKGSTSARTLNQYDSNGITYIFSKSNLDANQIYHFTKCLVNLTFASGSAIMNVYDGITTTNTIINKEKIAVSGKDNRSDISDIGTFTSDFKKDLRFDVFATTNITAGYISWEYYKSDQ